MSPRKTVLQVGSVLSGVEEVATDEYGWVQRVKQQASQVNGAVDLWERMLLATTSQSPKRVSLPLRTTLRIRADSVLLAKTLNPSLRSISRRSWSGNAWQDPRLLLSTRPSLQKTTSTSLFLIYDAVLSLRPRDEPLCGSRTRQTMRRWLWTGPKQTQLLV